MKFSKPEMYQVLLNAKTAAIAMLKGAPIAFVGILVLPATVIYGIVVFFPPWLSLSIAAVVALVIGWLVMNPGKK